MIKKKTLVIITPGFPSSESDTTCLPSPQTFVRSLNHKFPNLNIIILSLQYPYRSDHYAWFSNTIISFNGKKISWISRPWFWHKVYSALKSICVENDVIGILSFWCIETALVGSYFARANKIKHFIWIKGQDARKSNRLVSFIRPRAQELIALSDFLADEFERNHKVRPSYVIPNGISTSAFTRNHSSKKIDLAGVGSLIPLKQFEIFIDVLVEIVKVKPDVTAVIAGSGSEKNKLLKKIKHLGLEKNITMAGELPHEEILSTMQKTKILLHPSSYEGYSTVCLEALFSGCHVISFTAPEKKQVNHWHVVSNITEMIICSKNLILNEKDFEPVLVHDMNDNAERMMNLFDYKEDSTTS